MRLNEPIYLVKYAHYNYLIDKTVRKQICGYVKNNKNTNRLIKAVKDKKQSNTVKIKLGVKINCYHKEAMMFYDDNGNTNWKDAELL